MTRNNVAALVTKVAQAARIESRMTPHTQRHAAITAALNAGAHLRDVQDLARHADPETTMRDDRNRHASTAMRPTSSPSTPPAPEWKIRAFVTA